MYDVHPGVIFWDPILSVPHANSLISITLRTCTHTKVTSQTIIYPKPNPNPNQKNLKFGARNPNPFFNAADRRLFGRSEYLQKELGFRAPNLRFFFG